MLSRLLGALVVLVGVVLAGRVVRWLVNRALARTSADRQVRNLIHNLISVGTIVLAILGGLSALGLSVSVLVTSFGLTGLAVGLALQDLLRNVLAGIFLLVEQPFRIGDCDQRRRPQRHRRDHRAAHHRDPHARTAGSR